MPEHYTPTQLRILQVLSDGKMHPKCQLVACLEDDMALPGTIKVHLAYLRKKLNSLGEDILYQNGGIKGSGYRHIRYLSRLSPQQLAEKHAMDPS